MKQTLEDYIYSNHTQQSGDSYLYHINHFIAINPRAEKYQYADVVEYMEGLLKKHPKATYRHTILAAIKKYYDYLVFNGFRDDHPCKKFVIKGSKSRYIQVQDLFTPKELEMLLTRENRYKHLETRNKVVIGLLIYQGLTNDEVSRLDVDNIDLENGTVYVKASGGLARRTLQLRASQTVQLYKYIHEDRPRLLKVRTKEVTLGTRVVAIWDDTIQTTKKLIVGMRGVAITGDAIHAMIEQLKPLFLDKKLSPTTIRQSVIANWLNVDHLPIEDVQQMAGHKYPSSTVKYQRKDVNQQRKLINKFHPLNSN